MPNSFKITILAKRGKESPLRSSTLATRCSIYGRCPENRVDPPFGGTDVRPRHRRRRLPQLPAVVRGVEIRRRDETGMEAKIDINFKGIKQHFATRNSMERPTRIDMEFADGPFRKFTGFWRFTPLRADACKIEFALHYEFTNIILEKIIGPVFNHIANTFVESFVKRADQRYGKA
ncbi:type II toxin-antitoxin system RatA family toxin [Paraburkholderia dipogonis]|uniref:type II toxin-antitoxin system RatA family toxin n=1 Tax=Paraburkholderia dipogonis TaxID=1211383 RepID=UPI0036201D5D